MWWVVLAIAVFIAVSTFINIRYRKPYSYEPYQDAQERARIARVGYRRVSCRAGEPALRRLAPSAGVSPCPGGLPADLAASLIVRPTLPDAIGPVSAPAESGDGGLYEVRFACTLPDAHRQLDTARVYIKGANLYFVVSFAPLSRGLAARNAWTVVLFSVPPGGLPSGHFRAILVGRRSSKSWTLDVR